MYSAVAERGKMLGPAGEDRTVGGRAGCNGGALVCAGMCGVSLFLSRVVHCLRLPSVSFPPFLRFGFCPVFCPVRLCRASFCLPLDYLPLRLAYICPYFICCMCARRRSDGVEGRRRAGKRLPLLNTLTANIIPFQFRFLYDNVRPRGWAWCGQLASK